MAENLQKKRSFDVVELVDDLLRGAIKCRASDIHFEPQDSEMSVKYRIDGVLQTMEKLPKAISDNVISRLKVLGQLLTYRNDIPQEGRIQFDMDPENIFDQRLAVFPTINGQRAVVRLFYNNEDLLQIDNLGLLDQTRDRIKKIAVENQGLLLLTGPAGSGKSTTLAAILRFLIEKFPGKSIVTLEDPVEMRIKGITQVQITPHGQMTFPAALRSLLRQDPQILMIGEIRDAQTAKIAVEAALSGHFLMSTMHSGSTESAILRLLEMGIEPYQVTSSLKAVLNQRLIRKLCSECKTKDKNGRYKPHGCKDCFDTGFKGRCLTSELLEMDSDIRKAVLAKADLEQIKKITEKNKSILDDANMLVQTGVTTAQELEKVCPNFLENK